MRVALLVLASCGFLAACGQGAPSGPAGANSGGVFPNLFQTAYRSEGSIAGPDGQQVPIVMIRDGQKMRMEMTSPQGLVVIVMNNETNENFTIAAMGGRQVVMRQAQSDAVETPDELWTGDFSASATAAGPCTHSGEIGVEWRRTDETGDNRSCVTGDGIILWASRNGERTWDTTSVQRGAQDPALFAIPAGAQVMDLGQLGAGVQRP